MSNPSQDKTQANPPAGAAPGKPGGMGASLMEVPRARLVCVETPQLDGPLPNDGTLELTPGKEQTIGRDAGCTFAVPSRKLSRQHARIFGGVGTWGIEDLNSTNGVLVNKQRITTAWLKQGDEIRLGPVVFRYELDIPVHEATMAMTQVVGGPAAPTGSGNDDSGERTMMIGSLSASKAVIEASRGADAKPEANTSPIPPRPKTSTAAAAAPPRAPVNWTRIIVFAVLGLIVLGAGGAAAIYWPIYQKQQRMEEVAQAGARVVRIVVARVRDMSGPGALEGRFDEDVAAIRPALDRTWEVLATYPEEAALAEVYARLRVLSFERSFAAAFVKDDLAEAARLAQDAQGRLISIRRDLPATLDNAQKRELNTAIDLFDLANLLIQFREFQRKHPQVVASATNPPTKAEVMALDDEREQFIKLRRAYNKVLSIDYLVFNRLVQEVENRDLAVINHWREFLLTTQPQ